MKKKFIMLAILTVSLFGSNVMAGMERDVDDLNEQLLFAGLRKDIACINELIEKGADVNTTDYLGRTPLHNACLLAHNDVVHALIQNNANVNAKKQDGDTPLHCAIGVGAEKEGIALVKRGADPYLKNEAGKTPLDLMKDEALKKTVIGAWKRWKKTVDQAGDALKKVLPPEIVEQEIMKWVYPSEISGKEEDK